MKKLLLTTLIAGALAGSVFAQGTVSLNASSVHGYIQYNTGGTTANVSSGNPAQVSTYGQLDIAVYYASAGTATPFTATTASTLGSSWTESANVMHQIAPLAGDTPTTTMTLANAAGSSTVEVMVLGWTGTYADWNTAFKAGGELYGWTGSTLSTGSLEWQNATGAPLATPSVGAVALTYGAGGFNGLVLETIPEPSTFALAGDRKSVV